MELHRAHRSQGCEVRAIAKIAALAVFGAAVLLSRPIRSEPLSRVASAQASTAAPASADAASLQDSGASATLSFDVSAPVETAAFVLTTPDRVIVDTPQIDFRLDPETGKAVAPARKSGAAEAARILAQPQGLVAAFRFGRLGKGRSRIVIDLAGPARIVRAGCEADSSGRQRLVIELAQTDRARFAEDAANARAAMAQPAPAAPETQTAAGRPLVMIDPGHGGIDRGAVVNGLIEKDLVLDFARALAIRLEAEGRYQPVLTRDDDTFVPLGQRVKLARDRKAALFISIHADTLAEAAEVSGATVYTASDRASDAEAARLAEKENGADSVAGLDGAEDASEVTDILFDLTRRETRAYSHVFAHTLLNYWRVAGRLNKNPQRSAGFRVLKAPDVPSVLLELGYLSNEKDDRALASPAWREKAVGRMAEAITAFFAGRGDAGAAAADEPLPAKPVVAMPQDAPASRPDAAAAAR